MIATGLALFVAGILLAEVIHVHPKRWDARDIFSTLPAGIGLVMMFIGLVKWLWMVAP